jgi:hypothetical protein
MTTTKTIPDLLNLAPQVYEKVRFEKFFKYCESVSFNDNQFQMVIANAAICKWYNMEYQKCENEFLIIVSGYETAAEIMPIDFLTIYHDCTYRMFNLRSKILIDTAKKTNIYAN